MNCKQGDLAVVVRSKAGNEGRIVAVVEWVGRRSVDLPWNGINATAGWYCLGRCVSVGSSGRLIESDFGIFPDECLRPIRNNPGEDETLTWASKPEQVTA